LIDWKHRKRLLFAKKMCNLVLLLAMLSVVVACIAQTLCSCCSGVVSAACVSVTVEHILNEVFDYKVD